jgi:Reverse transcriptase (RNA-dependent DNA polymerase)
VRKVAPTGISPLEAREFLTGFPGLRCFGVACSLSGNGFREHGAKSNTRRHGSELLPPMAARPRFDYAVNDVNKPKITLNRLPGHRWSNRAFPRNYAALDPHPQAVIDAEETLYQGHLDVVDADLADYFGSIPHADLMRSLARRIVDSRVLHLIKMWLECAVEETDDRGQKKRTTEAKDSGRGIPQGSPISPLLANLYMRRFVCLASTTLTATGQDNCRRLGSCWNGSGVGWRSVSARAS